MKDRKDIRSIRGSRYAGKDKYKRRASYRCKSNWFCILMLTFVLVVSYMMPVHAAGNELHSMDISIDINDDGSAEITEIWDMSISEGTEVYKEMKNMSGSPIHSLTVTEGETTYQALDSWDINASREEKAYKSGIMQSGSDYELCFGVGDYGDHTYQMQYTIDNFVEEYKDMYGMNYQLVGEDTNVKPEKVTVRINSSQITEDTLVYAFGFDGSIHVEEDNGTHFIEASNNKDGSYGRINYVNILAGFDGASFSKSNPKHSDRTFEDMADEAKEGSSYQDNDPVRLIIKVVLIIVLVSSVFLFAIVIIFIKIVKKSKADNFKFTDGSTGAPNIKEVDYFRDIPANKDVFLFYYIVKKASLAGERQAQSGLLTGILLGWIRNKNVNFVKEEKQGAFRQQESYRIHFSDTPSFDTHMEQTLFSHFVSASGPDRVLENKEFEKWCSKNYTTMESWFTSVDSSVESMLRSSGYVEDRKEPGKVLFVFNYTKNVKYYTPKFKEVTYHSIGFKKFIAEFGRFGEKQVKEVVLWEDYLIFASVLGMAANVEKEIGRLYPEFREYSYIDPYYVPMATRAFTIAGISSMHSARSSENMSSSSGGGGSSSMGGGGGSFSGGGGGGVR